MKRSFDTPLENFEIACELEKSALANGAEVKNYIESNQSIEGGKANRRSASKKTIKILAMVIVFAFGAFALFLRFRS